MIAHAGPAGAVHAALDRVDLSTGAWITVTADRAVDQVRRGATGDLAGLTFAVKDLIDVQGVRTTYGSRLYADHVPTVTASVVRRLEERGAVMIGKTNLNEFAYGVTGLNPTYGIIKSPLNPAWTAGGSSGGSAAVVGEGVVDFAVGTDTSGSIRIPAACCGVVGLKLPYGSQPLDGVYPLSPSRDSIGYFARDVVTLCRILGLTDLPPRSTVRTRDGDDANVPPLPESHWVEFRVEAYMQHRARAQAYPDLYGDDLKLKMRQPDTEVIDDVRYELACWRRVFNQVMGDTQVLAGPVFVGHPPLVAEVIREYETDSLETSHRLMTHTPVASVLGWPAITVPTSRGPRQLLARPHDLPALLAKAAAIAEPTARE